MPVGTSLSGERSSAAPSGYAMPQSALRGRVAPLVSSDLPKLEKLMIQGHEAHGLVEGRLKVYYPADESREVGECYTLSLDRVDQVLDSAQRGFEAFRKSTPKNRADILLRLAQLLEAHHDDLARLITLESGKPIKLSLTEVRRAIEVCEGYGRQLAIWKTDTYWLEGANGPIECQVQRFPIGPVLAITPFNFPLNLIIHKLAPAIAAGNSITIKPASKTPLTALYLGRLAVEAGYEAISVVPCSSDVAEALVQSEVFKKLSFTGSSDVGWRLKSLAPRKSVTLELGGNAACIIEDFSQPVDELARRCAQGAFWYAGQICVSIQRLLVHHRLYDDFTSMFINATQNLKVGDPLLADTDVGPMVSLDDVHRVRGLIRDTIYQGGNVLYGGNTYNMFTMNPTILNRTTPEMAVNADEIFAPLVTLTPYKDYAQALAMVNHSRYGLQAGVYTVSRQKAQQAYESLEMGAVLINEVPTFRHDFLPYGGVKASGLGREGILTGLDEMSVLKTQVARW